jgi:hypothetical protein
VLDFLGTVTVQAKRDSGVGMWIQEIGNYLRRRPIFCFAQVSRSPSVARFLHTCSRSFSTCFNGAVLPREVRGRSVGVKFRTFRGLENGPDGSTHSRRRDPSSQHDGCVTRSCPRVKSDSEPGWMHNRVRMITAMYLTKDLMIDWRLGERVCDA